MAFKTTLTKKLNAVRFISKSDSALDLENCNYDEYMEDPNAKEATLKFLEGQAPTIFILNFELSGKEHAMLQDNMFGGVDEDKQPKITMGKWGYNAVKACLKDIQNPPNETQVIRLKKDSKGYVSDETMTELQKFGLVNELFNLYFSLTQTDIRSNSKN
jgi:hypothetical protein